MQPEDTAGRIALIRLAASLAHVTGCFEWVNSAAEIRVGKNAANRGVNPVQIRELARDWIVGGGAIRERVENRPAWQSRREYWYSIIIPVDEFARGLFVELELSNFDHDLPSVSLLNAHPQQEGRVI